MARTGKVTRTRTRLTDEAEHNVRMTTSSDVSQLSAARTPGGSRNGGLVRGREGGRRPARDSRAARQPTTRHDVDASRRWDRPVRRAGRHLPGRVPLERLGPAPLPRGRRGAVDLPGRFARARPRDQTTEVIATGGTGGCSWFRRTALVVSHGRRDHRIPLRGPDRCRLRRRRAAGTWHALRDGGSGGGPGVRRPGPVRPHP